MGTLTAFLAVDHQVIQVEHLAGAAVVAFVLGVVAQIGVIHDDVVPVLAVGEFVDGIRDAVGLHDEEEGAVAAADLDKPRLAEPVAGVQDGNVRQVPGH